MVHVCSVMSDSLWPYGRVALQAPLSMGFSRQDYWSGLPYPSPGDLPNPGIEPDSPALAGEFLPLAPLGKPETAIVRINEDLHINDKLINFTLLWAAFNTIYHSSLKYLLLDFTITLANPSTVPSHLLSLLFPRYSHSHNCICSHPLW